MTTQQLLLPFPKKNISSNIISLTVGLPPSGKNSRDVDSRTTAIYYIFTYDHEVRLFVFRLSLAESRRRGRRESKKDIISNPTRIKLIFLKMF